MPIRPGLLRRTDPSYPGAWQITEAGWTIQARLQPAKRSRHHKKHPRHSKTNIHPSATTARLASSRGQCQAPGVCATPAAILSRMNPARNGNFWTRDRGRKMDTSRRPATRSDRSDDLRHLQGTDKAAVGPAANMYAGCRDPESRNLRGPGPGRIGGGERGAALQARHRLEELRDFIRPQYNR